MKRASRRAAAATLVAGLLSGVAACSGSDSPTGARPTVPSTPTARPAARSLPPAVPPPASGMYWGANLDGLPGNTMADFERRLGRRLDLQRFFYRWGTVLPTPEMRSSSAQGRTLMVSIKPAGSWREVAGGAEDGYLHRLGRSLRSWGRPVLVSFHHEPENDRGRGTPADYRAAWRHVVEVLRSEKATNVSYGWIMMDWSFTKASGRHPDEWYPGDDVIDWLFVDVYNQWGLNGKYTAWTSFASGVDPFYRWATSVKPGRRDMPLGIAEWGSANDPADPGRRAEWLRSALTAMRVRPQLKLASYFNYGSARLTDGPSLAAFRAISDDPYVNQRPVQGRPSGRRTQPPPEASGLR